MVAARTRNSHFYWRCAALAVVLLGLIVLEVPFATAASSSSFTGASSAVQQGFTALQAAGKDGGNVSSLVAQLNGALALIQKAESENASNPVQATTDLQAALGMAQGVQASASGVAQNGISARQLQLELSLGSVFVIVAIAVALYTFGDRIYRRLWLRVYADHVVRKNG